MDKTPNLIIKEALSHAVELINEGINPTKALQKTADHYELNYDFTHRVGEALNVALHFNHFKTAEDKASEFPIADIPAVVSGMYKEEEKTASQLNDSFFGGVDPYEIIPNYNNILSNVAYKQAHLKIAGTTLEKKATLSPKAIFERSSNYIIELEKQATNSAVDALGAKNNMESVFLNLAAQFRKEASARTTFEEFESQVFAKHGAAAIEYVDMLHKVADSKEERGVHDSHYRFYDDSYELKEFGRFLKYAEELQELNKTAVAVKENLQFEKDFISNIYKSAEEIKIAADVEFEKEAAGMMDEIFETIKGKLKEEPKKGPGHTGSHLDNTERQALLQDLLVRDPILSKERPETVIRAYEQILRVAPNLSTQKEVVRAVLRKLTSSQALSPFDMNQFVEADTNIAKNRAMNAGHSFGGGK